MPTASTSAFPPSAPCPVAVPSDGKDHPVALDSVEEAVKAIAAGEFVVVVDDMDRENEGDLIIAASMISVEKMAWMIRHSS
jgi:hypothetical protein